MKIDVEVKEKTGNEAFYPALMQAPDGLIVLFWEHKKGTVISPVSPHDLASYRDDWVMTFFRPYHGSVKLTQE